LRVAPVICKPAERGNVLPQFLDPFHALARNSVYEAGSSALPIVDKDIPHTYYKGEYDSNYVKDIFHKIALAITYFLPDGVERSGTPVRCSDLLAGAFIFSLMFLPKIPGIFQSNDFWLFCNALTLLMKLFCYGRQHCGHFRWFANPALWLPKNPNVFEKSGTLIRN